MRVTYWGHAAFLLEGEHGRVLIDPFVSDNPKCPVTLDDVPKLDGILVTHGHGDHLGDAATLARRDGATVICVPEIGHWLSSQRIKGWCGMNLGGTVRFGWGSAKMVTALHSSSIEAPSGLIDGGVCCGFVVRMDGVTVYHAGDTCLTCDFALLAEEAIDLALVPVGGHYTMDMADAARALSMFQPTRAVPMHYDTFPAIETSIGEFASLVSPSIAVTILEPGESLEL